MIGGYIKVIFCVCVMSAVIYWILTKPQLMDYKRPGNIKVSANSRTNKMASMLKFQSLQDKIRLDLKRLVGLRFFKDVKEVKAFY